MKRSFRSVVITIVILIMITSCKMQENIPSTISIREFSSIDYPIICSLDSLLSLRGMPDSSFTYQNKKIIFDSLGRVLGCYPFTVYRYPDSYRSYTVCNDSAELFYINLRHNDNSIRFRNALLDGNTTMRQINKLLNVCDDDYGRIEDKETLLGYSDYGYLLMYFGEEYPLLGSVSFFFDNERKLIYIELSCPPGSIVYHFQ